jgi:DNA-binding protein H-NS
MHSISKPAEQTVSAITADRPQPSTVLLRRKRHPEPQGTLTMLKDAKIIIFPNATAAVGSMLPKKSSLDTLSNEALCKLRDEIAEELKSRAEGLRRQIDLLVGLTSSANNEHQSGPRKGYKVAPKYKGPHGEVWSGRGKNPRWLTIAMSEGKQLNDFLIGKPKKNHVSEARR